jgi:DNA polymerase-3 subunit beta
MKLIALQKNLKQGVFVSSYLTGKNNNLPILNNLMISAQDGVIKLLATDLEVGVTNIIRGKIENPGTFTVDAKVFSNYINLLPNQKVELEVKDGSLAVESDNYKTKIKGEGAEEYPLIPEINNEQFYSIKLEEFKKAIASVLFAVSSDESRLALSGILFSLNKDSLYLVGTDSYRLAEKKVSLKNNGAEEELKVIVPTKTLQELVRIMSGDYSDDKTADEVRIYLNDNQIAFKFDSVEVISRLIDEQYPDYKQIIPTNFKTNISIDKQELVRAVKAAAIFSKTGINDVNLDFLSDKGNLVISATSGQTGESIINLTTKIDGPDNSATINYKYLIDGLNHIESDLVKIEIIDPNAPCLFKPASGDDYIYIIMPIKR